MQCRYFVLRKDENQVVVDKTSTGGINEAAPDAWADVLANLDHDRTCEFVDLLLMLTFRCSHNRPAHHTIFAAHEEIMWDQSAS